jgi:hypothetical protein
MKNGTSKPTERTFAEFFAGIGLMRLGLERGGRQIAFANDIDPQKKEMYHENFPDAEEHFLLGDIHKLPASEIPTVALATASYVRHCSRKQPGWRIWLQNVCRIFLRVQKILEANRLKRIEGLPGYSDLFDVK